MVCSGCGANLEGLKCEYCGTLNKVTVVEAGISEISESELEVVSLRSRIEKLQSMKMPENLKKRKIQILEEQILLLTK